MTAKTIDDEFLARLDKMEADAKAKGLNLTVVCKHLGISRATPDRWKKERPKTVQLLDQMEKFVADAPAPDPAPTTEQPAA